MIVDRTTWVTTPGEKIPVIYRLDTQLLIPLYVIKVKINESKQHRLF